jgi:hypothetical protein
MMNVCPVRLTEAVIVPCAFESIAVGAPPGTMFSAASSAAFSACAAATIRARKRWASLSSRAESSMSSSISAK